MTLTSSLTPGKFIGSGSFGDVYLASDPLQGEVAIKVVRRKPGELQADWDARKSDLLIEAQNLVKASHRNVVPVYSFLEHNSGNAVLFTMEYCPGGSLQAVFEAGPVNIKRALSLATEATQGLKHLHGKGMLHRDIKPGNILVAKNGSAKIGDFGLVTDKLIFGYAAQAGYWDHLAPEVFAGGGTSAKSDVWALGMTIYRLLHGDVWYQEGPAPRTAIPLGGFAKKLRWLPHVPDRWRRVIRAALRDKPKDRIQTATEMFAQLSSLPAGPAWECDVTSAQITWHRVKKDRKITVVWNRSNPKKNEWRALSEPNSGTGQSKTLGGSTGPVGRVAAESQLQIFFDKQV